MELKTKFLQKLPGNCVHYCFANLFNAEFFTEYPNVIGLNYKQSNELLLNESNNAYCLRTLLKLRQPTKLHIPVFEQIDYGVVDLTEEQESVYTVYLIELDKNQDISHVVLGIREVYSKTIIILDPYKKSSSSQLITDFWNTTPCIGVDVFSNSDETEILFGESHFVHLRT